MQSKIALGMSLPDVIASLGIPEKKNQTADGGIVTLTYPGYVLDFAEAKLTAAHALRETGNYDLSLKPVEVQTPDYKPDSLVLNKDLQLEISAYYVAGYLQDESLFIKAVDAGVSTNGFTLKSNALCVALTEGFLNGTIAVMSAGFKDDIFLRTDKGTYIFPKDCITLQKDADTAGKLKKILTAIDDAAKAAYQTSGDATKADLKKDESSFWQDLKKFLEPKTPPEQNNRRTR